MCWLPGLIVLSSDPEFYREIPVYEKYVGVRVWENVQFYNSAAIISVLWLSCGAISTSAELLVDILSEFI